MNRKYLYQTVIPEITVVKIGSPLFAQIELTEKCQYSCIFCYNVWKRKPTGYKPNYLTSEQAFLVLDKLIESKVFSLIFSGGEPTLHPSLPELIYKAESHGIETTIISNGMRLTDKYIRALMNAGLKSIQISMHNYSADKMDKITQRVGSFNKTLNGVRETLKLMGNSAVSVNMVVTRETLRDIYEMGEFLHKEGVTNFSIGLVSYCGNAARNNVMVGNKEFLSAYSKLEKLHNDFGLNVAITGGLPLCIVPGKWDEGIVEVSNLCDAGINQVVIGPDGGIRPCVEMPFVVGNIFKDDLNRVWKCSKELIKIRKFENTPVSCYSCKLVAECHGGCRASAMSYTGQYLGKDPLMEVQDDIFPTSRY